MKPKPDRFNTLLLLLLGAAAVYLLAYSEWATGGSNNTAPVDITLPAKFYKADGAEMKPWVDYMYTEVVYGTCSDDDALLVNIAATTRVYPRFTTGRIEDVPVDVRWCFVATVISPAGQPVARSNVFEIVLDGTKPGKAHNLVVK
jgi:hypothetical protein